jgi:hypothetical protein
MANHCYDTGCWGLWMDNYYELVLCSTYNIFFVLGAICGGGVNAPTPLPYGESGSYVTSTQRTHDHGWPLIRWDAFCLDVRK